MNQPPDRSEQFIEGNDNFTAQGHDNLTNQGERNQAIRGDNNKINITNYNYYDSVDPSSTTQVRENRRKDSGLFFSRNISSQDYFMSSCRKIQVYLSCSYDRQDRKICDELEENISIFEEISIWHEQKIQPGSNRREEIKSRIQKTDIFMILVTPVYLTKKIKEKEYEYIINQSKLKNKIIIPVIVKPCAWKRIRILNEFQPLPTDGTPITGTNQKRWRRQDAYEIIMEEFQTIITQY